MDCPRCNSPNRPTANFCVACGAPIQGRCTQCGFQNQPTAKFCENCGAGFEPDNGSIKPKGRDGVAGGTPPAGYTVAQRRRLTVMFCDLVDSTALSTRLDLEDYRDVIDAYHDCCARVVARFGGFVAQYMGDGVLV